MKFFIGSSRICLGHTLPGMVLFQALFPFIRGSIETIARTIIKGSSLMLKLNPAFSIMKPKEKLNIMSNMLARLTTMVVILELWEGEAYLLESATRVGYSVDIANPARRVRGSAEKKKIRKKVRVPTARDMRTILIVPTLSMIAPRIRRPLIIPSE